MGVAVYCERSLCPWLAFYIHEGLKIARENHETSRYSYEYNNLAVTYWPSTNMKGAGGHPRGRTSSARFDREMHAYIYRNLSEICCHLDRLTKRRPR